MRQAVGRRAWPVRAGAALLGPFAAALVTGTADPPGQRAGWRTPESLQHLRRYLLARSVDVVVVVDVLIALTVFAGTNSALISANELAGGPVGDGELLLLAALATAAPLLLRDRWPLAAWRVSIPALIFALGVTRQVHSFEQGPYLPPLRSLRSRRAPCGSLRCCARCVLLPKIRPRVGNEGALGP